MRMPHFLLIGAAKSGTVSLYHYLDQHPQIFMSPVNETNFFALDGLDLQVYFNGPGDRATVRQHCIRQLTAYQNLFSAAGAHQIRGESSPLYLYSSHAPQRIYDYIPQVKLIAILRQPAERAYSNYRHNRRAGLETLTSFEQALAAEPERIDQGWGPWPFWHYQHVGFYAQQLENYLSRFDQNQMFICLYDDLLKNSDKLMERIFNFLGVDRTYSIDASTRHNLGGRPRVKAIHALITKQTPIIRAFKSLIPERLEDKLRRIYFSANIDKGQIHPRTKIRLNQVYQGDIQRLETIVNRDLNQWLSA